MSSLTRLGRWTTASLLAATMVLIGCGDDPPIGPPEPGTISGVVTIDGTGVSGITIDLSGLATASATTDESGAFSFAELEPGDYTVSISGTDSELVTFDMNSVAVTPQSAGTQDLSFAGTPTGVQRVLVYAYYGVEGTKPNVEPAEGFQVDVFPTESDRDAQANRLARNTTDQAGLAVLTFDRSDDAADGGGPTDNTVYTRVTGTPGPRQIGQTDLLQTVSYENHEVVALAPDTIDALNGDVTVRLRLQSIETDYVGPDGSGHLEIDWVTRLRTDTAGAPVASSQTGFDGLASYDLTEDVVDLPVVVYFRADDSQWDDAGNIWTQTPEPTAVATGTGRFMTYVHDGTRGPGGAVDLGIQRIEYVTQSVFSPVYHESDLGEASPTYTPPCDPNWEEPEPEENCDDVIHDDKDGATGILVEILEDDQETVVEWKQAPPNGEVFWNGPRFGSNPLHQAELMSMEVYYVRATSTDPDISIVTQTMYQIGMSGGGSVGTFGPNLGGFRHSARVCPLAPDTVINHCGAFAFKFNNTSVTGAVTGIQGMTVDLYRCTPPDRESCDRDGDPVATTTTGAAGVYTFSNLLEDIYEVVPDPSSTGHSSVTPAGGSPIVVTNGDGDAQTKNFTAS